MANDAGPASSSSSAAAAASVEWVAGDMFSAALLPEVGRMIATWGCFPNSLFIERRPNAHTHKTHSVLQKKAWTW